MNDKDKVRINVTYRDPETQEVEDVCYFYTDLFAEWIKALQFCREYDVPIFLREDDERVKPDALKKINDSCGALVEDYWVELGTTDYYSCIGVLLK